MIETIITKIFIGIISYLVAMGASYILAMVVIFIINKVKKAIKRKGAIYV